MTQTLAPAVGGRRARLPLLGLLAATALSITGNSIVALAVPWLVLERTGSAALAGVAGAAAVVPIVLSALFGGALIDRLGRRFCSVASDILSALAVAALPLLDATLGLAIGPLLVLVALGALFDSPGAAARESLRPDVARHCGVPLAKVNAWGEAAEGIGYLAGPALGGILLVVTGGFGTLWISVGLFTLAALVVWATVPHGLSPEPLREPYFRAVVDGLRFVLTEPTLRAVALTAAVVMAFVLPFESVVLNAHLQQVGEASSFGAILAAFAVGGIAGALGYGALAHRMPPRATLIGGLLLAGVLLGSFALLPPVWAMIALAAVCGVVTGPINPVCAMIMQRRTPERLRGRVLGSYTALAMAAGPVGLLVCGPLVDAFGPAIGFAVIGFGCLLSAGVAALTKGLRHLDRPGPGQGVTTILPGELRSNCVSPLAAADNGST